MDSRDSTATAVSGKDVSGEGDNVLSVFSSLAKDAAHLFQSRKFAECIDVLYQILRRKENDTKVLHNVAVAEFFRDGCSDPRKFLDCLNSIKKRNELLACASIEQSDTVGSVGNRTVSGGKGVNSQQQSSLNPPNVLYGEEYDTSVATLNTATIWFHLHEYEKALSTLEPLYQNIEPIDETIALRVCLLLLDASLASHALSKSADVIIYLEKAFGVVNQGEGGNVGQQQASNPVPKSSSAPANAALPDSSNTDAAPDVSDPLSRTLSEDTIEYDTLLSTLDISGQDVTRASGPSKASSDRSITTVDLKLKLQLFKVRLLLLSRNLKAAKRELKMAMNIVRGGDSSMALLLKSQLEYARGNYRKAIKLLMGSTNRADPAISSLLNNNLGCINSQLGKHHTSALLFSRALTHSSTLSKPPHLVSLSKDKSLIIIYNCGVQHLACRKPLLAAVCFQKAAAVLYSQPLLWVRIAECCLMASEMGLLDFPAAHNSAVKVNVIGNGKWRHLVIDNPSKNTTENGQPLLSMSLARQCLHNALHLLDFPIPKTPLKRNSSATTPEKGLSNSNMMLLNSVSDYESVIRRESFTMKQAVLADLAYVELALENSLAALSAAKNLLNIVDCSKIYVFLGRIYAAEALCQLNRPKEAAEYLSTYVSGEGVNIPYEECELTKSLGAEDLTVGSASVNSLEVAKPAGGICSRPEEARGALYVNLAFVSALQGDGEQAEKFAAQALSVIPNRVEAVVTAVYVDLVFGKTQEALVKLKQCNRVEFLWNGFSS